MRYILHSDLNNFYASVECMYNPELRNKAVIVVGDSEKRHGIVLAKSNLAKSKGIKTGDTIWEAEQKCPDVVPVKARLDVYQRVSRKVKSMYREYTDQMESFGIDEAWLDVSHRVRSWDEAVGLADEIRKRVIDEFGLTVSIGVSFNKVFAKLGSDLKKPNATTLISSENYKEVVWRLPVDSMIYIGSRTKAKLNKHNIFTLGDLAESSEHFMSLLIGKVGVMLRHMARGEDDSIVKWADEKDEVKSISNSTTCPRDLKKESEVKGVIYILAESVAERMRKEGFWTRDVSLSIKDSTLKYQCWQKKLEFATNLASDIANACLDLFKNYDWSTTVRAVGVRVSNWDNGQNQMSLFYDTAKHTKREKLECVVENLRDRWGYDIIKRGVVVADKDMIELNPYSDAHTIHPVSFLKGAIQNGEESQS